ncbi:MAG TPA: hypothetical protein VHC22_12240 [Pirellulales bacterium]|nr:hypothetical protein [Pirellulales bacterium]
MLACFLLAVAGGCQRSSPVSGERSIAARQPGEPLSIALQRLADAGASVNVHGHHRATTKTGTSVKFHDQEVGADLLANLREVDEPLFLRFERCRFVRGAFKTLDGLDNVVLLSGDSNLADDDILADIATLPGLEVMSLWLSGITARGLAFLASAKPLKELEIGGNGIDDRVLALLADHEELVSLRISSTSISDDGMRHLSHLPHLHRLALDNCQITDAGLQHLTDDGELVVLELAGTRITGTGFDKLRSLRSLQHLILSGSPVTDAGLADIATLSGLESVDLSGSQVTDAGLAHLAQLPSLRAIGIRNTRITNAGIARLPRSCQWNIDVLDTQVTAGAHRLLPKATISVGTGRLRKRQEAEPDEE